MDRARILVITSTYPRRAGDTLPLFVHELCRRLASDFEIHVLAPHCLGALTLETLDGVQVHRFRYLPERLETLAYGGGILPGLKRRPWRILALAPLLLAEYLAIAKLLRRHRFALIHAHWLIPHGFIAAFCKHPGQALLTTSHGSDLFGLAGRWFRLLQGYALGKADAATVVSQTLLEKAATFSQAADKLKLLPMGIDTTNFSPPAGPAIRDGLLYVGRLVADKGVQVLLDALMLLTHDGVDTHLTIIGTGPEEVRLKARVQALGLGQRVQFLGALPNDALPPYYRKAKLLIFPSLLGPQGQQEGMGLVPLEALACGCPVVASRLPAVSEIIQDEVTGLLFTPGDSRELAQAVARMWREPGLSSDTASRGRQRVESAYDWERTAAAYRELYLQLIRHIGTGLSSTH